MMHLIRYRMLQIVREKSLMFWGFCFPVILGTFFYFSFGQLGKEHFDKVSAALVTRFESEFFSAYLGELDGSLLELLPMTEEEAAAALEQGKVSGIFYEAAKPSLAVAGSGMEETILAFLLETYEQNAAIFAKLARSRSESLPAALKGISEYQSYTERVSLGGKTYDNTLDYYFALLAMACFYGTFLGATLGNENSASFSTLGARRAIAPVSKLKVIAADMAAGVTIHFACVLLLLLYLRLVLGIAFGDRPGLLLLICFLGSLSGVSLGAVIGCSRLREGFQTLLIVVIPLLLCFLAGLMFSGMKQLIEAHLPILNRINPAALISDALYSLTIYEDPGRLRQSLCLLACFCLALTLFAWLRMRRIRYDRI